MYRAGFKESKLTTRESLKKELSQAQHSSCLFQIKSLKHKKPTDMKIQTLQEQ